MHGRETPPSRVWRQTEGEGHEWGDSQRGKGELGEEWKLRATAGLGKGLKTANII